MRCGWISALVLIWGCLGNEEICFSKQVLSPNVGTFQPGATGGQTSQFGMIPSRNAPFDWTQNSSTNASQAAQCPQASTLDSSQVFCDQIPPSTYADGRVGGPLQLSGPLYQPGGRPPEAHSPSTQMGGQAAPPTRSTPEPIPTPSGLRH